MIPPGVFTWPIGAGVLKALAWIAAVLLLALTMVIALPFSATGTRLLIAWVNDSGLLRVEYAGGQPVWRP